VRLNCKGFVYVLRGKTSGNYKIGFTKGVANRVRELAYDAGESLEILAAFPGTEYDEAQLLERVHPHRIVVANNGEWLRPHADVVALVESLHPATRISYAVDVVQRKSRKPRRTPEQIKSDRAARFLELHGHAETDYYEDGCAACKRLEAARARAWDREIADYANPRPTAWSRLYDTLDAHCAQAPALTGGA
jgi:hypothetical protein